MISKLEIPSLAYNENKFSL